MKFLTKAGTLEALEGVLKTARVLPLVRVPYNQWKSDTESVIKKITKLFGSNDLIVRSSYSGEDQDGKSEAGAYLSFLNVNVSGIPKAINEVFRSYPENGDCEEVLVQPMLLNVVASGVGFSHDPNTCSPYRLINWSEGDDTSLVTSGNGGRLWQQAAQAAVSAPPRLSLAISLLEELLHIFENKPLDFEFAITEDNNNEEIWLLQARPLTLRCEPESIFFQTNRLSKIEGKVRRHMRPHPFVMGQKTVYGVMPDWNPAEIVGIRPKPLALSLYRELITDAIWAYQRHNYGYRNLRSFPLMPHFFGQPYIDVRLSFNSFIPSDLNDGLAGRIVDYYVERLLDQPNLHDKVEFEIVFSCYTLDLHDRMKSLLNYGFQDRELRELSDSLRKLTNRVLDPNDGLLRKDAEKLETLHDRREKLLSSALDPLEKIYWLIEDTKRYGTLPFAGLARAGFIAVQMLRSLVAVGVLSNAECDQFIRGVSTVSGQLARDRSILDKNTFLARYGHLRPGTYDILSPRYDERPELYFNFDEKPSLTEVEEPLKLTLDQMRKTGRLLRDHGLQIDPVELFEFIQNGIEMRELSKFQFTRNLSDVLSLVADVGEVYGLSREEMAFTDIAVFKELHIGAYDDEARLKNSIAQGRAQYEESLKLSLPPVITRPEDIWAFEWPLTHPNYITQLQVTASVASVEQKELLEGSIVCIPSADPGYDWLFSHRIAGLITAWGGANSHMAIRAGELGLPAVIGAGDIFFQKWSSARRLHVDCAGKRVEILS